MLNHARGYHGLLLDEDILIGWDGRGAFVRADYEGDLTSWIPGIENAEQMIWTEDGGFFYGDSYIGSVIQVSPTGSRTIRAEGMEYVYGLQWGPDGKIWVADGNILRIDPDSGEVELLIEYPWDESWYSHSLGFNLDCTELYIGTLGYGQVLVVASTTTLDPVGEPRLFANTRGGWHDSMEMDACGNLWIADYWISALIRIAPDGEMTEVIRRDEVQYGHGVLWGNDVGGWRSDAIYLPQPYNGNKVREVVVGVPDGSLERTWKGEPFPL